MENGGVGIEPVAIGGRPLQLTLNERKEATIHERVMELLTIVHPRAFDRLSPAKIIELFKLGDGTPPNLGMRASVVVDGFYRVLGFTRLTSDSVIRKAIARGVQEATFGYSTGALPVFGRDGKYQVPLAKVRFGTAVSEDEIDLESGFLMMPQAIPQPAPPPSPTPPPDELTGIGAGDLTKGETGTGPGVPPATRIPPSTPTPPSGIVASQKVVEIAFSADRNQLYTAWDAMANLADLAGKVNVSVRAESESGFDRNKLQNAVLEPLREAELIE